MASASVSLRHASHNVVISGIKHAVRRRRESTKPVSRAGAVLSLINDEDNGGTATLNSPHSGFLVSS